MADEMLDRFTEIILDRNTFGCRIPREQCHACRREAQDLAAALTAVVTEEGLAV